ncbi:MAG TPA: DMT family transporter [Burkholderiales bacterium]|jgi:drug/metabolite transporter (DMT)-like permease|nr:DMT family transporter [Burkholderiales bacterium]
MRFTAWLVLLATLLLWSGNWIVARAVRDDISPGLATAGRLVIVVALLAPFAWRGLAAKLPALSRRDWQVLWLLAFFGGGLHLALQWLGLHYTTATSATLYLSTAPIFILLLAAPLLGERIAARQWLGVAISFTGVALIGMQGKLLQPSFNVGDLCALASMAMWGGYTVFLRMRHDTLDIVEFLAMVCLLGLVFMAPWVVVEYFVGMRLQLTAAGSAAVLYSAIGSLLLAYAGWSYVVKRMGAARAGATMHLMPAIAVILAAVFLGERPYWYHFAGVLLILAGVALASMRARAAA